MSSNFYKAALCSSVILFSGSVVAQEAIFDKERSDYTREGARIGAFKLKSGLVLEEKFDDNIYASNAGKVDDIITNFKPSLSLESDWNRHSLGIYTSGDLAAYHDKNNENYSDYKVGANGSLEVLRETFITAGLDFQEKHEDRGSPDSTASSIKPTEYREIVGDIGFYRGLRKFSLNVDGQARDLNFEDGLTAADAVINNDNRDREEYKVSARLAYEFIPDYKAFMAGIYNDRKYDETGKIDRDSDGYEITVGTAVNISGKTKGEVFVGYMSQKYDSSALSNINGAAFGASVLWNPTQITSVSAGITRSIEETSTASSSGYVATNYNVAVEHELLRNILVGVNGSFSSNDYESSTAVEREDKIFNVGTEVRYLVNRNATIKLAYGYKDRDSNIANQDYARNIITLGLNVGF